MALEAIPSKTEDSLGQVKQDNIPDGVTIDPRYWTSAEQLEAIKTTLIDLATDAGTDVAPAAGSAKARLNDLEALSGGAGAGAFLPTEARVANFDDFDDPSLPGWVIETTTGGTAKWAASAAALGFPSSGCVALEIDATIGAKVTLRRAATGLVLDAATPIAIEYRWTAVNAGVFADTEHVRYMGLAADAGLSNAIVLLALWDAGTSTRSYVLAVRRAGVLTSSAVVLPALGAGTGYTVRIEVSTTRAEVWAGVDDGALASIGSIVIAPTEAVYFPYLRHDIDAGSGGRSLLVDRCSWSAARYADLAGAATGSEFTAVTAAVTDHGALTGLADDDHAQYLLANGTRGLTGDLAVTALATIDGRDVSVDGTKLDTIATGAAAVGAGIGPTARANSDGVSALAAHVDHAHDAGVVHPERKMASFIASSAIGEYLIDTSAGDVIVTLPACSQRSFRFKKITEDTYKILIVPNGSDTIEGKNATYFLPGSDTTERRSWDLRGSTQASATGWWLFSLSGVPAQLDLSTGGTFGRALEASYLTSASTMLWAAAGERVMENRGDGYGAMLRMEPAATNAIVRSEEFDSASWVKSGVTPLADQVAAPDGTVDADSLAFTASATDEVYQTFTATDAHRVCFSVWMRAAAAQTARLVLLKKDGAEAAAVSCVLSTTWQRFQIVGTIGSGATVPRAIIRNHSDAAARTVYAWGAQVESSATVVTASSYIRTTGATVTRPADTLSYAVGQYPAAFLTAGMELDAVPEISSADLPTHANALMALSFQVLQSWMGLTYGAASFYIFANGSSTLIAATWAALARLRMRWRPTAGVAQMTGGLTGNAPGSVVAISAISSSGTLYIGIRADTSAANWFGRLGRFVLTPGVS